MAEAKRGGGETWCQHHSTEVAAVQELAQKIRRFLAALRKPQTEDEREAALLSVSIATLSAADVLGRDDLSDARINLARVAAAEYKTWLVTGRCDGAHLGEPAREYLAIVEALEDSRSCLTCPTVSLPPGSQEPPASGGLSVPACRVGMSDRWVGLEKNGAGQE
jgi:hypothetical protein